MSRAGGYPYYQTDKIDSGYIVVYSTGLSSCYCAARSSSPRSPDELLYQLIKFVTFIVERAMAAVHERHELRMGNFPMHLLRLAEWNDLVVNTMHDQCRYLDARQVGIQIEVPQHNDDRGCRPAGGLHAHAIEPIREWLGDVPEEENVRHAEHHVRPVVQRLLQQLRGRLLGEATWRCRIDQHELGYAAAIVTYDVFNRDRASGRMSGEHEIFQLQLLNDGADVVRKPL